MGSQRLQEHNPLGTVLGRCEPAIRLHVIAGHDLIGCRDEAIELLLFPYKVRAFHGAGIAVVLKRTGFPSDDIVEVRTQAIVAFLGRVAGPACVVECQLPRLGVGALTRWLLGHGRETQKHQECGADQSRDCGAGHDVLLAIERASPHGGLAAARYHTVAPERRCVPHSAHADARPYPRGAFQARPPLPVYAHIMLARPRTLPTGFIAPCLPTKTDKLPSGGLWLHEIKHDGFRIIARNGMARVRPRPWRTSPSR